MMIMFTLCPLWVSLVLSQTCWDSSSCIMYPINPLYEKKKKNDKTLPVYYNSDWYIRKKTYPTHPLHVLWQSSPDMMCSVEYINKVHTFWVGHKIRNNLPVSFQITLEEKSGSYSSNCGLLGIYEIGFL